MLAVGHLDAEDRLVGVDAGAVEHLHELQRLHLGVAAEALGDRLTRGGLERGALPALVRGVRLGELVVGRPSCLSSSRSVERWRRAVAT